MRSLDRLLPVTVPLNPRAPRAQHRDSHVEIN